MKQCSKCKEVKGLDCFGNRKSRGRDVINSMCRTCAAYSQKLANAKYRKNNKKRFQELTKKYEKRRKITRPHYFVHGKKMNRDSLADTYIKKVLKQQNLPITPETIEVKREIIKLNRLIKSK